jgi:hypothetical protein
MLIKRPRKAPFISLTAIGISLVKGLKYKLLDLLRNGLNGAWQDSLSSEEMIRKTILSGLQSFITFSSLVKNHVDNFILVTDVFCRFRHELVYNFGEKVDISTSIVAYSRYKFS